MNHLFKTKEKIYESANSVIYRGIRRKDQLPVVLKKMNRSDASPIHLSRFRREFSIAARFNHPGIIRVYDILEADEGSLFIAMEDCGGESVHRYFDHFHDLTLEEQLNMACRIAEYLEHIHALKIIHLDINPANIVWCPDLDLIKIIDFGISSELSPEIEYLNPSALEGTLAYMSPEQTGRMNRPVDYRADLYSLGVTFYELFTGKLPFSHDDPLALIHAHIAITPTKASQLNKNLPDAVCQIISKLMAKDADDRYQSAAGVKYDLQYCLNSLAKSSAISSFKIASNDVSTVFKVPQKHYFREQESSMLISAFEGVCESGKSYLTLVAGHSGVGKSVFVGEIVKQVIKKMPFTYRGKFSEMEHAIPHAVIIQAFAGLFEHFLSDTQEHLTYWRDKIMDDIVDLMISKMRKLSGESRQIIKTAACIGSCVSLNKLIIASGFNRDALLSYLADLVKQGFLTAPSTSKYLNDTKSFIEVNFHFLHDRIHQAAYHLIEESDKFHLKIGLCFLEKLNENSSDITIFDVVKQCNMVLNLHCDCAETALFLYNFKLANALCEIILGNAHSLVDKCFAWNIQIMERIAQGNPGEAVHLGLQALRKLEIKIKSNPPYLYLFLSLCKSKLLLKKNL